LTKFCHDVALDNNLNPNKIPSGTTIIITKQFMEQFDY
jgi:hypothetical protein